MDFIRPLVMPVLVVLIVSTIWVMSWTKQMDDEAERARHPNPRAMLVLQSSSLDELEP